MNSNRFYAIGVTTLILTLSPCAFSQEYTFGQWAADTGLPIDARVAEAAGQGITSLDGLSNYTNLSLLFLQDNQITHLESGEFSGLTLLDDLRLDGNQISSISAGVFSGVDNLLTLNLANNLVTSIDSGAFAGLGDLEILSLQNNQISHIAADGFSGLTGGDVFLHLMGNQITSIDSGAFSVIDLFSLELGDNPLVAMNLTEANLSDVFWFSIGETDVTEVSLAGATISQWSFPEIMNGNSEYGHLIPTEGIATKSGILSLDLSGADISEVEWLFDMSSMADLVELDMAGTLFADSIIAGDHAHLLELLTALEDQSLDALTIDMALYQARQVYFDTWDAVPANTLTVVPEPATMILLALGGVALLRRKGE